MRRNFYYCNLLEDEVPQESNNISVDNMTLNDFISPIRRAIGPVLSKADTLRFANLVNAEASRLGIFGATAAYANIMASPDGKVFSVGTPVTEIASLDSSRSNFLNIPIRNIRPAIEKSYLEERMRYLERESVAHEEALQRINNEAWVVKSSISKLEQKIRIGSRLCPAANTVDCVVEDIEQD